MKADCGLSDDQIYENVELLGMYGQSDSSQMMQIYAVAAALFVLVLAAGVMMIASSLNSNVAQRTEFFGLMRYIGATPKQVIRLVRRHSSGASLLSRQGSG
ncbi:MAG: FtsX-like permease family protein [Enterocloster clostridioformis]